MPQNMSCVFTHTENKGADQLRIHWETDKALKQWQLALSLNNSFSNFEFSNFFMLDSNWHSNLQKLALILK